jgi:hypothetical protein
MAASFVKPPNLKNTAAAPSEGFPGIEIRLGRLIQEMIGRFVNSGNNLSDSG